MDWVLYDVFRTKKAAIAQGNLIIDTGVAKAVKVVPHKTKKATFLLFIRPLGTGKRKRSNG